MPSGVRFTAYLSPGELEQMENLAREYNTSVNYVLRMAVRQFLREPETFVTRNNHDALDDTRTIPHR
jgi:hypothetical protein